ncbi:BST1 [Candida theae]|uniref:GPI inositol-deacylase n=1 Tax=Candida theae TaxID=1198502 RepID=A0AAD5FXL8_9ASCO|nr:BST1 [Candida theae]KAI5954720.1 BST1 [Candida theae]
MRPNTARLSRSPFYITILLGGLLILLTLKSYTSKLNGPDAPSCRPVWMYPSYIKIHSFDQSHTKYASKYSIYLYREQGRDKEPPESSGGDNIASMELEGVPVLFIPGNAGNHRQVRSIAARTSELHDESNYGGCNPKLDFFTVDYNEDFTAFHGRTILDQAEYANEAVKFILSLYSNRANPPKSVIVIGHSMGGIVARIMLTLPDYASDSIKDILTLSSPHSTSPLTFDGDLSTIYSAVDKFWYCGFNNCSAASTSKLNQLSSVAHTRLHDVALISITGGALDSTLPADYTTLGYLVPKTNGFTAFTTGIPQVWTPIDHLAVVWCQQLRTRIALALRELTCLRDTATLEDRIGVYERYFLTGFEDYAAEDRRLSTIPKEEIFGREEMSKETLNKLDEGAVYTNNQLGSLNTFSLDKKKDYQFTLISSTPLGKLREGQDREHQRAVGVYNEGSASGITDVSSLQATIPNFSKGVPDISHSSYDGDTPPMYSLVLNSTTLKRYSNIVITLPKDEQATVYCQLSTNPGNYTLNTESGFLSWIKFFTIGSSISLPSSRPVSTNLKIPQAWSSLYVYKLKFTHEGGKESQLEGQNFNTFIRQWTEDPFESKWYTNGVPDSGEGELQLTMHGVAPYVPYKVQSDYGMNLQVWSGDDMAKPLNISVSIDIIASLKLLILRYRITIVGMNVAIVCVVLMLQFGKYCSSGKFPAFDQTLIYLNSRYWPVIMGALIILNYAINVPWVNKLMHHLDPVVLTDYNKFVIDETESGFKSNELYLGLSQGFTIIGVLLYLCCNFVVWLTYIALMVLGIILNYIVVRKHPLRFNIASQRVKSALVKLQVYFMAGVILLTPWYLPYQIVYLICCVYQGVHVLRSWATRTSPSKSNGEREVGKEEEGDEVENEIETVFNFQVSWLMLMLWILPINIPILIVFIHNLQVNWTTPFSSHHNLLSILPILLATYYNNALVGRGRSSNKGRRKSQSGSDEGGALPKLSGTVVKLVETILGYIVYYSLVYGSRHTFYLHHLFNLLSCLIFIVFFSSESAAATGTGDTINGQTKQLGLELKLS